MSDQLKPRCRKELHIVFMPPDEVYDRPLVGNIFHYNAHPVAAHGVAVFREITGGKRRPFVHVNFRRGPQQHDSAGSLSQQSSQCPQQITSVLRAWDVVKGKPRKDQIECMRSNGSKVAAVYQRVIPVRISFPGQINHAAGYVNASSVEPEFLHEPRGSSRATAKIESAPATARSENVFADDRRQLAKRQVIRSRKLERCVGLRSVCIVIYVGK